MLRKKKQTKGEKRQKNYTRWLRPLCQGESGEALPSVVIPYWSLSNNKLVKIRFGYGCFLKTTLDLHFTMSYHVIVYQIVILTLCEKGSSLLGVCRWSEGALQFRDANLANHSRPWLRTSFSGNVFLSIQILFSSKTIHPIGNAISKC